MPKLTTAMLERMRIPPVHWYATIASIPTKCPQRKHLSAWVDTIAENLTKPRGLLLHGDYGRGKSAAAAICLKAAATLGELGYWVSAREIPYLQINQIPFDSQQSSWDRMLTVPLLVLDELVFRGDNYTESVDEMVFRYRVDARLPTVITTNLSLSTLASKFPSLMSVMQEAVVPIKFEGHDFREIIAKELV